MDFVVAYHLDLFLRECDNKSFKVLYSVKATDFTATWQSKNNLKNFTVQILLAGIVHTEIKTKIFK